MNELVFRSKWVSKDRKVKSRPIPLIADMLMRNKNFSESPKALKQNAFSDLRVVYEMETSSNALERNGLKVLHT